MPENYIYAVTRIRAHEKYLLNKNEMESLASAKNLPDALNQLASKGWDAPPAAGGGLDALTEDEYRKTWALIAEAAGQTDELNIFRKARDFHNLKAAIKLTYKGKPILNKALYFLEYGLVPVGQLIQAAESLDFMSLPDYLAKAGVTAWETLIASGNGRLCETAIDRITLEALAAEGKSLKSPLLKRYVIFNVDMANINAAKRCHSLGLGREFLERALADGGLLDKEGLINASLCGQSEINRFLRHTPYAGAASAGSPGAFERWRNDQLIRMIRPYSKAIVGVEPLAAYILARENEISIIRFILRSKAAGLSEGAVKERLGLTYV